MNARQKPCLNHDQRPISCESEWHRTHRLTHYLHGHVHYPAHEAVLILVNTTKLAHTTLVVLKEVRFVVLDQELLSAFHQTLNQVFC